LFYLINILFIVLEGLISDVVYTDDFGCVRKKLVDCARSPPICWITMGVGCIRMLTNAFYSQHCCVTTMCLLTSGGVKTASELHK